jgi:hypothetical protein
VDRFGGENQRKAVKIKDFTRAMQRGDMMQIVASNVITQFGVLDELSSCIMPNRKDV